MTLLPFEVLPKTPAQKRDRFAEFWSYAKRKVAKGAAERAYQKAIKLADEDTIMLAWIEFNKRVSGGFWLSEAQKKFIPYPATWLNQRRWEDEYDTAPRRQPHTPESLAIIAAHVRKPYYDGRYGRDVLQQCVDEGLLTVAEMEAKS